MISDSVHIKLLFKKISRRKYLLNINHWRNWLQIQIIQLFLRKPNVPIRQIGEGYGSWSVPDYSYSESDLVILVGVGEDVSLDTFFAELGCETILCDPTPRAIKHAKEKLSRYRNVEIIEKGIWTSPGRTRFYLPKDSEHVSLSIVNLQNTSDFIELEVTTIPNLLARFHSRDPSILKLDIEGAAYLVLLDLFQKGIYPQNVLVDLESSITTSELIYLLITFRKLGYNLFWNSNRDCLFVRNLDVS